MSGAGKTLVKRARPFYVRWWSVALVVIGIAIALSGCGGTGGTPSTTPRTVAETQVSLPPATTTSATGNGAGATSNFWVTIDSTSQVTDDAGNAALMVAFTFTNNSSTTTTFLEQPIFVDASQGSTNLGAAVINGDDGDIAHGGKHIAPGGSVQIHWAYELVDKSDVTIEAIVMSNGNEVTLDTKTVSVH